MKKLYFLFMMLLTMLGATTAFAQDEVTIPVNMDYGKWISWNGNESNPWARTWFSSTTPAISICTAIGSSNNAQNFVEDIRGKQFYAANNMSSWGTARKDLMFFTRFSSNDAPYEITVAEGWYLTGVEFDFDCANDKEQSDGSLALTIGSDGEEIISSDMGDVQHVSWTNDDPDVYSIQFLLRRIEGTYNFARTSNFYVHVKKLPEVITALQELQSTLAAYENYTFTAGTEPGLYGAEEVAAFEAAVAEAHETENNPDLSTMPDDELAALYRSLAERLVTTYEAVVASKVPMSLADGYYRLLNGQAYYTTETVVDEETQEETTKTIYHDKYLSTSVAGETISAVWNTPDDVDSHCPSLFKITNKDGYYDIVSMATNARFDNVKPVTLSVSNTNLMAIDPVTTVDGVTYANIRHADVEDLSGQIYLHCGSHGSGTGVSGNLTLWYSTYAEGTPHASEWVFVPVNEEEAQAIIEAYGPIREQEMLVYNFTTTMADAQEKMEIARDRSFTPTETALITEATQFSSPCSDRDEGKDFGALLDGNGSTIWHGDWHGDYTGSVQYFQVEILDPEADAATMWFQRRNTTANQITQWTVYGVDDADAGIGAGEKLAVLNTPYGDPAEEITTETFPFNGHKIIRFYFTGNTNSSAKYAHLAEFQLFKADVHQSPTAQSFVLGDVFTDLQTQVRNLMGVESEDVTLEQYNTLKAAYDAFIAKFVDPRPLREALDNQTTAVDGIVIGNNPGFWNAGAGAGAFRALYDEAVAYDASGAYTAEKSESYIEQLNQGAQDIFASANQIKEGKWYRIRFATEDEFEQYNWDKVAGNGQRNEKIDAYTSQPLFGKYLTVSNPLTETATYTNEEGEEVKVNVYVTEDQVEAADMGLGKYLFFDDKEDIKDGEGLDLFRFVAVGDSAYILQNKGTNLFVKAAGTSGYARLSAHPSLFNVRAIGYGENVIAAKSITGANQNYLHAQVAQNVLVTWDASTPGSRSGLYIEEVEDVTGENVEFNVPIVYGSVHAFCFPVDITVNEGQMWTVNSINTETNEITMAKIESAEGGRPFIYINGETSEYSADEEADMVVFKLGFDVKGTEPQTNNALKGTYESIVLDRGDVYCKGNELVVNTVEKDAIMVELTRVYANEAYISAESKFDPTAELSVIWDETLDDGIVEALTNVSKSGAIYTIDGRLVSKKGSLNDVSRYGKGVYILNGTKVVVK